MCWWPQGRCCRQGFPRHRAPGGRGTGQLVLPSSRGFFLVGENSRIWLNSKSIRSSAGLRGAARKAACPPRLWVRSLLSSGSVMPALTSVGFCSRSFLNAERLSLAGAGQGRVAEATRSLMLPVAWAFIGFSLLWVMKLPSGASPQQIWPVLVKPAEEFAATPCPWFTGARGVLLLRAKAPASRPAFGRCLARSPVSCSVARGSADLGARPGRRGCAGFSTASRSCSQPAFAPLLWGPSLSFKCPFLVLCSSWIV